MKRIIFTVPILAFLLNLNAQTLPQQLQIKDKFLVRSEKEKKTAWTLLGTGLGIAALGGIIQLQHESSRDGGFELNFTGTWIAMAGGTVSLLSIPIFISSGVHSRKAASLSLNNQRFLHPQANSGVFNSLPSASLKITF